MEFIPNQQDSINIRFKDKGKSVRAQRGLIEGSEGVSRGLPLETPSIPPRCPLDAPSEVRQDDREKAGKSGYR
jgi:hypothetical protein